MKKSHMWLMLLCCLIPVIGLTAVYLFRVPLTSVLLYGMVLLCPVSHLLMMKYMSHDHSEAQNDLSRQNNVHHPHTAEMLPRLEDKK